MTIEIVSTRVSGINDNFVTTVYSGMGDEMIAAGILPADFLDFRGSRRVCGRSWWGKKKRTRTTFPPGVTHIHLERRANGLCEAEICHEAGNPPYVPPGQVWPQPEAEQQRTENEASFQEDAVRHSGMLLGGLIHHVVKDDAHRYDAESLRAIRLHADRLLEAIERGRVVKITAPRGEVVRLDQWRRRPSLVRTDPINPSGGMS